MSEEYRPVLDQWRGGYWPGFDPDRELVFIRDGWQGPESFKLVDQGPYYNIAGLYWREPKFSAP